MAVITSISSSRGGNYGDGDCIPRQRFGGVLMRVILALFGFSCMFGGSSKFGENALIQQQTQKQAERALSLRARAGVDDATTTTIQGMTARTITRLTDQEDNVDSSATSQIPQRIIVVDTRYTDLDEMPEPYLSNVKNTLEIYKNLWGGEDNMDVVYMGDDACQKAIEQADIRLVKYYWKEKDGMYKSDLCRYAALFLHGGYYFDNDMVAVKPVPISPQKTFVSPREFKTGGDGSKKGAGLFNSFIAVAPRHAIIKNTLYYALQYYEKGMKFGTHMGTGALFRAYNSIEDLDIRVAADTEMEEIRLSDTNYPDFPRLDGVGCCCDIVVHSARNQEVYFYSHFVGDEGKYTCGARPASKN